MLFTAVNCSFKATNNMDQGSVVVLFRRTTHSSFVAMSYVHRDLYYSRLNPAVTTSDPRQLLLRFIPQEPCRLHLILYGIRSQVINKNKLLDKSQKIIYTWQVAGEGGGTLKQQCCKNVTHNHRLYRWILGLDIISGIV